MFSHHNTPYYTSLESSSTMEEGTTVTSEEENSITTTEEENTETYQEYTVSSEGDSSAMDTQHVAIMDIDDKTHSRGKYQYMTDLGQGGFGTVIKARVTKTQQVVAIKIVKGRETGMKEIKTLMSLPHPSIVGFLDHYQYFDTTEGVAIVMEFCPGGSLKDQMNMCSTKYEPIKALLRYEWYMQLASGLQFIHNQDIIHRDLKPDNILITANNSLKIAWLKLHGMESDQIHLVTLFACT